MNTLKKLLQLFSRQEKYVAAIILFLLVAMALLETAGVASILPFLTLLSDPQQVLSHPQLSIIYHELRFSSPESFLQALGIASTGVILCSAAFKIFTLYALNRFIHMQAHSLSLRMLDRYLHQPYSFFLNRNSGDLAGAILSAVQDVATYALQPGLYILAYSVVALSLCGLLVAMDPMLALVVGTLIGGVYVGLFLLARNTLERIGADRLAANRERFTTAGEALGGIKDIKLLGREHAYLSRFRPSSVRFSRHQATTATLSEAPKFFVEAIGIGGVLSLALHLNATKHGIADTLPVMGLYAFAGFKLLPAAQQVYSGMSKIQFAAAAVDSIHQELGSGLPRESATGHDAKNAARLPLEKQIVLQSISFKYANTESYALENVNFTVPAGTSLGIVGGSGAGKTTLVDLLLGLLEPTGGSIVIDGKPLTSQLMRQWQRSLGYVPQKIFLTDSSLIENIAFGVPLVEIDAQAVEECAKLAQLHTFISSELPDGYRTGVGERGVRLSGGQIQRIGIARALYTDPALLVLDEATSALDTVTESDFMRAIDLVGQTKTVILIAHRLSTVRNCDQVVLLEKGRIEAIGTYDELVATSERFRSLAGSETVAGDTY